MWFRKETLLVFHSEFVRQNLHTGEVKYNRLQGIAYVTHVHLTGFENIVLLQCYFAYTDENGDVRWRAVFVISQVSKAGHLFSCVPALVVELRSLDNYTGDTTGPAVECPDLLI